MRQDYASIINFFSKHSDNTNIYIENVKDRMKLPALYFELPETDLFQHLLHNGYSYDNQAFIQVFHTSDVNANDLAMSLAQELMNKCCYIPLIDKDGNNTGDLLYINLRNVRRIDECHSQIEISWTSIFQYISEDIKINKLNISINTKGVD